MLRAVKIDVTAFRQVLEESRDVHADAMRRVRATLPELREIGATRRALLAKIGTAAAGLLAVRATSAVADTALDVRILQTASSLEALAVATYGTVLGHGPDQLDAPGYRAVAGIAVTSARDAFTAFATETMRQHAEHKRAFQAQTTALDRGAKVQDAPNPKFLPALRSADLSSVEKVVGFAALLEQIATDTYLTNLALLQDTPTKAIMAGVMGVEAQHLATLRTITALLQAGTPQLVAFPFPAGRIKDLPQAAGTVSVPDPLHKVGGPELLAEPLSGALP